MFYNTIDPVLLDLGPVQIRYYGLVYVFGFLLALYFLNRYKDRLKLTEDDIYDLLMYLILGVLIGARLAHVLFWEPSFYLANPLEIFMLWKGGMAFHGGLIGIMVAAWLYSKKKKINWLVLGDVLAAPAVFALAIGRLANFANQELYGPVTDKAWCVVFESAEGCRHPYQIYSFLKRMLVFSWLVFLMMKKKFKDGFIFWNMFFLINLGRFFIDFWRVDARLLLLTAGQYLAVVLFLIASFILWKDYRQEFKKIF
ncbi:MAG: prolipoprotein diacylglyceryl transferase [Candidatus Nanoarchaeia archaeon]